MASADFQRQLAGYGLTTAQIFYRRPDHKWLLQSYLWQKYDLFPEFPELHKFLEFWQAKLKARCTPCRSRTPADQAGGIACGGWGVQAALAVA